MLKKVFIQIYQAWPVVGIKNILDINNVAQEITPAIFT